MDKKLISAKKYCDLGYSYQIKGNPDKALECYRKANQIDPTFAEAYCGLGVIYAEKNNYDESIKCFRKFRELAPECVESLNDSFYKDVKKGNCSKVDECYMEAVGIV